MKFSMRSAARESMARRGIIGAVLLACLLLSGGPAFSEEEAPEAPPVEVPKTGMKSGQLTAKHEKSAEINGQEYAFHLKILLADDRGEWREWKEFKRGDYVQYHLKQGQIDFLLLELPK
jgi:hypothetical protein